MTSLLDPKVEEEVPEEKWYALIMMDDASAIWHLSDHPSEAEAMDTLRELVFRCIGGHDDSNYVDDDSHYHTMREIYMDWTLDDMNGRLEGEHEQPTVFCQKAGTVNRVGENDE